MRKIFAIFAVALVALAVNAAVININTGTSDALRKALSSAASGDVIVMAAGTYVESNSDYLAFTGKNVTVMAEEGAEVIIVPKVPVRLKAGARAEFINVKFDCGHLSDLGSYSEIIVAADDTEGKKVILDGCEFYGWTQKSNAIVHVRSDRRMDSVVIKNCYFHDNKYTCVYLKHASIQGVEITNSTFANITTDANAPSAAPIQVDATSGTVLIDHCTFYNCQVKNTDYGAVKIPNAIAPVVSNCIFAMPEAYDGGRAVYNTDGEVKNCLTYNYSKDNNTGLHSGPTITACITGDPLFRDAANGDYHISAGSPAFGAGTAESDLGDPRWVPVMEYYLAGSMNNWTVDPAYKLTANPGNEGEYLISKLFLAGDQFKVIMSDGAEIAAWYPDGMDNNYAIARSGEYTVYFRPDGLGGDDWHYGCIYAAPVDLGPWSAWFGDAGGQEEFDSYLTYDEAAAKATVHIASDRTGQWRAQIKYQGPAAEDGKCYRIALKMKANNDISGVTLKWQDDNNTPNVIYENQSINLGANEEYIFDEVVKAVLGEQGGNGILILDFGWAQAGDVIDIYGVTIEETECPEPEKYYLVGTFNEWAATEDYLFAENTAATGEYMLDTKLTEGDQLKVVGISGENENYYPAGFANNYIVDAAHAGWVTVYFRPAGNPEWEAFGGYFYINVRQSIENVEMQSKTVKYIENGELIILKNGTKYTPQGQQL